jgi:UDP-GlcNAc:undecaprenyl-phosphate GlcNAc-1-phosphate transferase
VTSWVIGLVLGVAALTSILLLFVVVPPLRASGVVAVPTGRSLHQEDVVRGGGLAVLGGVVVAVLVGGLLLGAQDPASGAGRWLLPGTVTVTCLGLLGFVDDVRTLGTRSRLLVQLAVGTAWGLLVLTRSEATWAWLPLVVLAVISLVNATNFMDGANGVVAGHAVVAGAWYAVVAVREEQWGALVLATAVAGAAAGFLPANVPTARVFLGDVGSYSLGAAWAVLSTWLAVSGAPLTAVVAPLAVLLVDTGATLGRRMVAGDPVTTPHRLHVYQRLVHGGWSHSRAALTVGALTGAACVLAWPSLVGTGLAARVLALGGIALICLAYVALPAMAGGNARWQAARSPAP